jgi:general secretion pathway protein D
MTRPIRPAAILLLMLAIILPAIAGSKAGTFYNKGKDAEARENYEEAYDLYKQAYDLDPKDLKYRAAYERLRFLAGASHVHRGQLLQDTGKLTEALAEFQKAAEIDPSSPIATLEIKRTQKMIEEANAPKAQSTLAFPPNPLERRLERAQGPVELAPISNVPITLKLAPADTKVIYETVGKLAGINVLFDPEYTSRRVSIELNGVTLEQALQIIALESKTFWRPVTPNTIFVAADNPAKRKELEQSVIKTFYLGNMSQPTEMQDMVNAMRQILGIAKIQPLPSQEAIVIRATPDEVALAQKLVDDLDKAKPEVVVDVAIMQVSRDKIRNLGINPPTSATVALQNNINTTQTSTTTTSGTGVTSTTGGTPNQVNLNRLGNLNATDFTVTIPSATATAMFSDSTVKLLQNPQIRSVNGEKASLKIGEKLPVATGSFQPGIGGVGINPLVNTQFTYLDVGVNVDLTPTIHADHEVTLKVKLDISSQTSTVNIGGITQPVIGQRTIEHVIRLKEGEASLLGGMFEDQNTRSLSGIPGLAQIPILKYFFSETDTEHSENEVVFVLIPHIVRDFSTEDINQRAIDVGTENNIQLNEVSQTAPAQPATTQSGGVGSAPAETPAPAAPENPSASTNQASFAFDPATVNVTKGSTVAVNVMLNGAQNVYSVPLQVSYDPKLLQVVNISNGGFLSQDGQAVALMHRGEDDGGGTLQINASRPPGAQGVSGQGSVVTLTLLAKSSGQGTLTISKGGARNPGMQSIPVAGAVANVNVQ